MLLELLMVDWYIKLFDDAAGFQKYGGEILPQEECKKADMRLCLSVIDIICILRQIQQLNWDTN